MKNKYGKLIKDLKAKNFTDIKIKEAILEKAKKEINHFNFNFKGFKVKELEDEKKFIEIEGYASTKDIDRYGDVVEPTAFDETMELFMKNPVLLLQHDHNKRIGDVTEYEIDSNGLYIKADVKYTAGDDELFEKIEGKSLKGFSIGWRILEAEWLEGSDGDYLFVVKKLDLVEISVVNVPANPYTLMKSIEDLAIKSFNTLVKEADEEEKEEVPGDDENTNDNQEENTEENENDNNEEKEKELKVEIKDDKLDDPEADNDGGDIEDEDDTEEKEDEENDTEEEKEDIPEEKKIDEKEEKDNIEDDTEDPENPKEEKDDEKAGETEEEKSITTKAIEKIVDARIGGNDKAFKTLVKKEIKTLTSNFEKQIKAVKSELEKELDAIVELIKEVKDTEQEIVDRIKGTVKGKGFINFKTSKEKKVENTRLSYILSGAKNKRF